MKFAQNILRNFSLTFSKHFIISVKLQRLALVVYNNDGKIVLQGKKLLRSFGYVLQLATYFRP